MLNKDLISKEVFILDGARTAIGSPFRSLKNFNATQLATIVIKELLRRNRLNKKFVDEIILGNTVSAGTGQNLARAAGVLAGLPASVPGFVVNNVCGAGLQAVILAAQSILSKEFNVIVAGGVESATHSPYLVHKDVDEKKIAQNLLDSLISDGLWCSLVGKRMGELADYAAEKFSISRIKQDAYAMESHLKALRAQKQGRFKEEIVPIPITKTKTLVKDDRPRKDIDLKSLMSLKPVFKKEGTATAGSSSVPCDGAAAVIVASRAAVRSHQLKPNARILGYTSIATKPELVFAAGVHAIKTCLEKCRLPIEKIDLFEIDEAFATQAILTKKKLNIPDEKMNIFGGDIALGHPLGAAGARILVTLLHSLMDRKKKRGLACVCLGGGGSIAMAVEIIQK